MALNLPPGWECEWWRVGSPTWPKVEAHPQLPVTPARKVSKASQKRTPGHSLCELSAQGSSLAIEVFCQSGSLEARESRILTRVPFIQSPQFSLDCAYISSESEGLFHTLPGRKVRSIKSRETDFLMLLIKQKPLSGKVLKTPRL